MRGGVEIPNDGITVSGSVEIPNDGITVRGGVENTKLLDKGEGWCRNTK